MKTSSTKTQAGVMRKQATHAKRSNVPRYSIEFFHIYTDERITDRHVMGLRYLQEAERAWTFDRDHIVLIDNYNPVVHVTTAQDVLHYLESQEMTPDYWAFEGSLIDNAKLLLEKLTDKKLRKNYLRYIEQHNKYPCSLLTATWYLTRLGYLPHEGVIKSTIKRAYKPASRLLNFLPQDYKSIEDRAHTLITKSEFKDAAYLVQDFFYPIEAGRAVDLF